MSRAPLFVTFLLFILGKQLLHQNDVEFDFSIGYALVNFPFSYIINREIKVYLFHTLEINKFCPAPNLMIIIMGTFRNTKNPLTIWNNPISHRFISSLSIYESAESSCWWHMNFKCMTWAKFSLQRPEIFRHYFRHHKDNELKFKK